MDALPPPVASPRSPLLRLWRDHVRRKGGLLALIVLLTALVAGLTALYPIVIQRAFDMFSSKDARILYQIPIFVVIVTAAKAATQYVRNVLVQTMVLRIITELQMRMFRHLSFADLSRVEREAPAQLSSRFTTDASAVREALTRAVNSLSDGITVLGLIASMLYMNWVLSVVAALLYPFAAVPIQKLGKRIRRASGSMQERMGDVSAVLHESFAQARTVRAYRLEEVETSRAQTAFDALYRALLRMARGRARVDPVLEVLGGTAVAVVIGFAGWRSAQGEGTVGDFTGFVTALLMASQPLRALGSLNAAVQEGLAGLVRVFSVVDEPPAVVDQPGAPPLPPGEGRVRFEDVRFFYPDGRAALSGLSFEAAPGRTVALVGPSGAGKSTALALIPRLHDVSGGRVLVDGADVRDVSTASLRDAIAYVGQDALLFDDTVAANIALGRPGATEAEIEAAADAAAAGFVRSLPDGFNTRVGPGGQRLSGGQRQRVALARALLRNPRILLLDEATSALDAESEAAVQEALLRLRRDRTTIVVAHRLSTVRDADLVVTMAEGRAAESGTHTVLLARDGLYARLVRTQALAA